MKRQFGLPAAFALTLLAFLFFGFTRANRLPLPLPGRNPVAEESFLLSVPPEMSEEVGQAAGSSSATSLPAQPEMFDPFRQETFTFQPLPQPPVVVDSLPEVTLPGPGSPDSVCGCGDLIGAIPMEASGLDNPPRASVQVPPAYPPTARATGLAGEVWVEFAVNESGRVLRAQVVRSSNPMFDEPTLRAVAQWRFEPGRKNGRPVSFRMVVPVSYRLN